MDDVAAREVPVYFEVEEEIISAPSKVSTSACSPSAAFMGACVHMLKCVLVFSLFMELWRYHKTRCDTLKLPLHCWTGITGRYYERS